MKSIVRLIACAGVLALATHGLAEEQIAWVPDFRTACGMAAEQKRLVLLHFYNDNCGPCVRVEQNVFSKKEVADAVAQNYLAVKVHAGKQPQLASRYRVNQWPTDVFVTPSGLEVFRSVSPQASTDYIAMLNQVATQTGVGAARQWKRDMAPAAAAATANATTAVQSTASSALADAQAGSKAATAEVQGAVNQGQQAWGAAVSQFKQASDQARKTASQSLETAKAAAHDAEQKATTTAQQTKQEVVATTQQAQQQVQQQTQAMTSQWRSAEQQVADKVSTAARDIRSQWQPPTGSSLLERHSAFAPMETSPAAATTAAPAPAAAAPAAETAAASPAAPSTANVAAAATAPPAAASTEPAAPAPTTNPWVAPPLVATQPAVEPAPAAPAPSAAPPLVTAPPLTNAPPLATAPSLATAPPLTTAPPLASTPPIAATAPAAATPPALPAPTTNPLAAAPKDGLVPASQAPPLALDGFCPVTLLETVARDPKDRGAWKKGDKRFGAIHRGKTYLFTSAENQQKFLANPDAFAPVLAGCDPVQYAERGTMVEGKRAYGLITPDKRIFLFADEASRNRFEQSPTSYGAAVEQAMLRSESGNLRR